VKKADALDTESAIPQDRARQGRLRRNSALYAQEAGDADFPKQDYITITFFSIFLATPWKSNCQKNGDGGYLNYIEII
jgi:hypothetical protein